MSAHSHRGKRASWRSRRRETRNLFAVTGDEKTLPEALAELAPDPEPVPHGDAVIPEGATPAEDFPGDGSRTMRRPSPRQGPAQPLPRGVHPFVAGALNAPRKPGTRHTVPFRPEFADEGVLPRPYAPRNMPRPWLATDTWRRRSHPLTQQGHDLTGFVREHMSAVAYPGPRALPSEVAAFFRRISTITGTRSSFEQAPRCVAWAPAIGAPVSAVATGPQRRLTEPTFTPHAGRAA